ncbi:MAG: ribosomal L7Ae/L30e/S12e/Gadd45 family protein [Nanoarchaeota archaeon]|nr:ribosomal L7Ae/L30e/S12e/Gadd45 family protein [Nanoarchaeota archaeon]MBU1644647.1 ribosomal L7Ae/L30e/S12e/Gadd45 family protein [Nanoarchaeota archaeon]MBU1976898.1 ribosomal L7Ae/L30e/S12e/Gadd45 family protein [Nanoarchaeota archaeon]
MAKKEEVSKELKELKEKVQEGKSIMGKERTLKSLREKTVDKVYLANKCPQQIKDEIQHYAKLANVPVIELSLDNEELGLFCKKSFMITVLGTKN